MSTVITGLTSLQMLSNKVSLSPRDSVLVTILDKSFVTITHRCDGRPTSHSDKFKRSKFKVVQDPTSKAMTISTDGLKLSFGRQSDSTAYEVLRECFPGNENAFSSFIFNDNDSKQSTISKTETKSVPNMRRPAVKSDVASHVPNYPQLKMTMQPISAQSKENARLDKSQLRKSSNGDIQRREEETTRSTFRHSSEGSAAQIPQSSFNVKFEDDMKYEPKALIRSNENPKKRQNDMVQDDIEDNFDDFEDQPFSMTPKVHPSEDKPFSRSHELTDPPPLKNSTLPGLDNILSGTKSATKSITHHQTQSNWLKDANISKSASNGNQIIPSSSKSGRSTPDPDMPNKPAIDQNRLRTNRISYFSTLPKSTNIESYFKSSSTSHQIRASDIITPKRLDDIYSSKSKAATSSNTLKPLHITVYEQDDEELSLSWRGVVERHRHGGIMNLGNTCYMAATMQALLNLRDFVDDVVSPLWTDIIEISNERIKAGSMMNDGQLSDQNNERMISSSCLIQMISIVKQVRSSQGAIGLHDLKTAIESQFARFAGNDQHDAHEFFIDLMNSMHEELVMRLGLYLQVRSLPKQLPSTPLSTSGRSQIISEKELDSMNTTTETLDESTENEEIKVEDYGMYIPTQRQFFSDVRTSFSCIHCGYAREAINEPYTNYGVDLEDEISPSSPKENVTDLTSSPTTPSTDFFQEKSFVQRPIPLESLLDEFFADEIRELDCEKCHAKGGRVKIRKAVNILPKVLVVHLKRFKYDIKRNTTVKIHRPVIFPKYLDISSHSCSDAHTLSIPSLSDVAIKIVTKPCAIIAPEESHRILENLRCKSTPKSPRYEQDIDRPSSSIAQVSDDSSDKLPPDCALDSVPAGFNIEDHMAAPTTPIINTTAESELVEFEDANGWLCPKCHEGNPAINSFCSGCVYIRRSRKSDPIGIVNEDPIDTAKGASLDSYFKARYLEPFSKNLDRMHDIGLKGGSESSGKKRSYQTTLNEARVNSTAINLEKTPLTSSSKKLRNEYSTGSSERTETKQLGSSSHSGEYMLSAVIRHQGRGTGFGHYICDKFTVDDVKKESTWIRCNDSIVYSVTEDDVLSDQTTPYILFYVRQ